MADDPPLLEVRDLNVHYGQVHAVRGVSFDVAAGEIVVLLGANGAGKTTTISALMGLVRPSSGSVRFDGKEVAGVPAHAAAVSGIGLSPEGRQVFPTLSVRENLLMGAYTQRDKSVVREAEEYWFDTFPRLRERRDQPAGTLSGGEQQMLAIARALMSRPKLLLLDEPSLGMAPIVIETLKDVIRDVNRRGTSILLVEQNAPLALGLADRGYILTLGAISMSGSAAELADTDAVVAAYLGTAETS
jgi:branched-chain amino acid transport system ATP-binding protein